MLRIDGLHTHYGAIHALKGIDMEVKEGEIVTLIGSNGAGKSTLIHSLVGLVKPSSGSIIYRGRDITKLSPHHMTGLGMSISPEGREVFPELTVEENLRIGAYIIKDKAKISEGYERVYRLFPRLKERYKQQAGTLSGGEQQMLAVGRALMSKPQILLLDEPSLGLAPNFVNMIFGMIKEINQQGVTILLIEQNANMALAIADRAYVLENGKVRMSGAAKDIAADSGVRKAYLGLG